MDPDHHQKFRGDWSRQLGLVRPVTDRRTDATADPPPMCVPTRPNANGHFRYLSPLALRARGLITCAEIHDHYATDMPSARESDLPSLDSRSVQSLSRARTPDGLARAAGK